DDVTPAAGIVISVSDGELTDALPPFSITVLNVNDVPIIQGAPQLSIEQESFYSFAPTATDDDGDQLTFSITSKPSWLQFDVQTGELFGSPTNNDVGVHGGIVITVTDGKEDASLPQFSIEVVDVEVKPEAIDDEFNLQSNIDDKYILNVLANDIHPEGYELEITSASSSHGSIIIVGNQLELTLDKPVNDVSVQYFIQTDILIDSELNEEFKDSATATITIDRSLDASKPIIDVPGDIDIQAEALFTKVDLGTPTAKDSLGNFLPVSLVDGITMFEPGVNAVYWHAIDNDGNEAVETQIVRVHPLISLPKDVTIEEGESYYIVEVHLNGQAPNYPITIPYTVSSSDELIYTDAVTIEEGTIGNIELDISDLNANNWLVSLSDELNLGNKNSFTLTISKEMVKPEVSSQVWQAREQRLIIERLAGDVQVQAMVNNAKQSDTFDYYWSSEAIDTGSAENSDTFIFDPSVLTAGIYELNVDVTKNSTLDLVTKHQIFIEVREQLEKLDPTKDTDGDLIPDSEEGYQDSDNDGIPDYLDAVSECNVMQEQAIKSDSYLVEVEPGLCIRRGITVADSHYSGLQLHIIEDNIVPDEEKPNIGGVFDFVITNLKQPGDLASLVIPQTTPIPSNAQYTKYDTKSQTWVDFSIGAEHGYLSSAKGEPGYCPPPGNPMTSDIWTHGLTEGHWCVQLTIKDGGDNDADHIVNGTVVDPGGVSIILNGNSIPVAKDDVYNVYVNTEESLAVLENDTDNDAGDQLFITSVSTNIGSVSHDGQYILFKAPDGQVGQAVVEYSVVDSQGAPAKATAIINIIDGVPPIDEALPVNEEVTASSGGSIGGGILSLLVLIGLIRRQNHSQQ
ncbi:Ig-like domain-containing protein, partial [Photobacterium sanguinicancri]|uniref:Ig-like domain-containing protein n=1 Tax=Photobacterium sanguinicancri TaxID=875932 RepID=UPI0026E14830